MEYVLKYEKKNTTYFVNLNFKIGLPYCCWLVLSILI